jgi:hypothetical protein
MRGKTIPRAILKNLRLRDFWGLFCKTKDLYAISKISRGFFGERAEPEYDMWPTGPTRQLTPVNSSAGGAGPSWGIFSIGLGRPWALGPPERIGRRRQNRGARGALAGGPAAGRGGSPAAAASGGRGAARAGAPGSGVGFAGGALRWRRKAAEAETARARGGVREGGVSGGFGRLGCVCGCAWKVRVRTSRPGRQCRRPAAWDRGGVRWRTAGLDWGRGERQLSTAGGR